MTTLVFDKTPNDPEDDWTTERRKVEFFLSVLVPRKKYTIIVERPLPLGNITRKQDTKCT